MRIMKGRRAQGVSMSVVAVAEEANEAYYGSPVRPTDIVIKQSAYNPRSLDLRNTATMVMK